MSGSGPRLASIGVTMQCPLPVSGAECVAVMRRAGYRALGRTSDGAYLVTRVLGETLAIPDLPVLGPEELVELLHVAQIPYSRFLDLLSETPSPRPRSGSNWR